MLTDIRDIMSLFDSNPDIKKLIINNFNYIIKKIINNNNTFYPQMSTLISSFYKTIYYYNKNNSYIIENICDFISIVSKETIIADLNNLNNSITEREEHLFELLEMNEKMINNYKKTHPHKDIYEKYYNCRINKKFNHIDATRASIYLDTDNFNKMNYYFGMKFEPNIAIDFALLSEEEMMNVNMIMKHKIDIKQAITTVNLLNNDNIMKALNIFKRGILFENAVDMIDNYMADEVIENIIKIIKEGIEYSIAREISSFDQEEQQRIIKLYRNKKINIIQTVIQNIDIHRISGFFTLIENNVDENNALNIIQDESIDFIQFNNFIILVEEKIEYKFALNIVKKFDFNQIILFEVIVEYKVDPKIAYNVIDTFEEDQVNEFLTLLNEKINAEIAYDMIMLYDEDERILCKEFMMNNLSYNFVDNYNDVPSSANL